MCTIKLLLFNIISGFIFFSIMGFTIAKGSNAVPYYLMTIFVLVWLFEIKFKGFRLIGIILTVILTILALWSLAPFFFAA